MISGLEGFANEAMQEFPNIINIEVYRGRCPASCVHCPVGVTSTNERIKRFGEKSMQLSLFSKIVSEISEHKHATVRIHSVGEPLLWVDLPYALKMTNDMLVKSWVFTSAITLDRALLKTVCKYADIVEVSANSIDASDYRATKGVDAFDLVKSNIEFMCRFIAQEGLKTRLLVSRVQSPDRTSDKAFVGHWKSSGLVRDAFVRSYHTYNDLLDNLPSVSKNHKTGSCLVHWGRFNISADGYVVVCFNELFKEKLDASFILGDVRKETVFAIWHGDKLSSLRRAEIKGDYSNLGFAESLPCRDCGFCQPLGGNRQTSEYQIEEINGDV